MPGEYLLFVVKNKANLKYLICMKIMRYHTINLENTDPSTRILETGTRTWLAR